MSVNFRINKAILQPLLARTLGVVPSSAALPILQCFQIHCSPGYISVTATNFDSSIRAASSEIHTLDTFTAVFPAKRLNSIISKTDSGDIEVEIDNSVATITSGSAVWQLQLPVGDSFPEMPTEYSLTEVDDLSRFR